jgi:hypothetical protein
MRYEVVKDGNRYGIYGYQCECIIVYGKKKSLQKICDRLNGKEER